MTKLHLCLFEMFSPRIPNYDLCKVIEHSTFEPTWPDHFSLVFQSVCVLSGFCQNSRHETNLWPLDFRWINWDVGVGRSDGFSSLSLPFLSADTRGVCFLDWRQGCQINTAQKNQILNFNFENLATPESTKLFRVARASKYFRLNPPKFLFIWRHQKRTPLCVSHGKIAWDCFIHSFLRAQWRLGNFQKSNQNGTPVSPDMKYHKMKKIMFVFISRLLGVILAMFGLYLQYSDEFSHPSTECSFVYVIRRCFPTRKWWFFSWPVSFSTHTFKSSEIIFSVTSVFI